MGVKERAIKQVETLEKVTTYYAYKTKMERAADYLSWAYKFKKLSEKDFLMLVDRLDKVYQKWEIVC